VTSFNRVGIAPRDERSTRGPMGTRLYNGCTKPFARLKTHS